MRVEHAPLNNLVQGTCGLGRSDAIQSDSVPSGGCTARDPNERIICPGTWVKRRHRPFGKVEVPTNPFGFAHNEWIVPELQTRCVSGHVRTSNM
jgi:hypothetical protein